MTSSEHLMHVQVTTCVHGNFKIFELDQGKLSKKEKDCVEVAFNKPAGLYPASLLDMHCYTGVFEGLYPVA